MTITSLSDLYFIVLGLLSYNIIFEILSDTSLIYLPIIMVIYEALTDGFESSKNMSDTAFTLKSMEVKFYVMVLAYSLAVVPVHNFKLEGVSQYTRQCNIDSTQEVIEENMDDLLQFGNSEFDNLQHRALTARDMLVSVSGYDIEIPIMLKLVLKLGTGVSLQGVKNLPCTVNLVGVSERLMDAQIQDPFLKMETKEFIKQCFNRAKNMAITSQDKNLEWIEDLDTDNQPWPGHRSFMNSAYYGNEALGMSSSIVLSGYESYYEKNKKPTCREWWEGKGSGKAGEVSVSSIETSLKQRLIQNMDSKLKTYLSLYVNKTAKAKEEDQLLKAYYFNPYNFSDILNAETKDYGNEAEGAAGWLGDKLFRTLGTAGMLVDAVPSYSGASMIQLAAPIAKGVLLMVIIGMLPMAYIVSKYSFKFVVAVHFFLFSVLMWPYLWDLAMLAQQSYIEETISNSSVPILSMLTQPNVMLTSKLLTDGLFLAFPLLLTSLLTAAGLSGGANLSNMAGSPGQSVGSPSKSGGKSGQSKAGSFAKQAATKAATKGKGKAK